MIHRELIIITITIEVTTETTQIITDRITIIITDYEYYDGKDQTMPN